MKTATKKTTTAAIKDWDRCNKKVEAAKKALAQAEGELCTARIGLKQAVLPADAKPGEVFNVVDGGKVLSVNLSASDGTTCKAAWRNCAPCNDGACSVKK